ncbi:MAG: hypothetical protein HY690_14730 [Chloroflexi bacterium]|nr:hypothetical protein [Chloroflexota bacterium]
MPDEGFGHSRWAVYVTSVGGTGWVLHGIFSTPVDAEAHARHFHPRVVVPVSLRGRPPERFSGVDAMKRWFGVQDP